MARGSSRVVEHSATNCMIKGSNPTCRRITSESIAIKNFFCKLRLFVISQSVCPWHAFPAYSKFVGKTRAYSSEPPFRCSTLWQAPGQAHKHETRLAKLTRDKHSRLLRISVNYGQKSFMIQAPEPNAVRLFSSVTYDCSL